MSAKVPWSVAMDRAVERHSHVTLVGAPGVSLDGVEGAIQESYRNMEEPEETGLLLHSLVTEQRGEFTLHVEVELKRPWDYGLGMNDGIVGNANDGETIVPVLAKVLSWVDIASGVRVFRKEVKAGRKHLHWFDIWRDTVVPAVVREALRNQGSAVSEGV